MIWERFIFASDNHGDHGDRHAIDILIRYCDLWKPSIRIHGGDNFDFRPLRRKASEEERRELIRADFDAGMQFLDRFKPTHFLRGNHDERLYDLSITNNGIRSEYATSLIDELEGVLASLKTKTLPYDKRLGVLELGKLRAIHGYCHGVTAARKNALTYGSVISGHTHGIQVASVEGIDNRVGRVVGCLCDLDMEYSRATMASLVHRHGFMSGVVNKKTGEYHVWQAEEINGTWILPSDIVVMK